MNNMKSSVKIKSFEDVTDFHGHECAGTAIGYRVAEIAINRLDLSPAQDEELLAIVENYSCSVDAIQVLTSCTIGKGNLIFKDHGKHAYTFVNRDTGESLRISLKKSLDEIDPEFAEIREKIFNNSASAEEELIFEKKKEEIIQKILTLPEQELFKIESVEVKIPGEARIFPSLKCAKCGEFVSEHRSRIEDGRIVCIPCFHDYSGR